MANKNETAKKVVGGVALGLVLVLAGGVCGGLLQRHFNWGEDPAVETPAGETANGGAIIGESQGSGARLMSTKIAAADYEEYGVSPMAETAYQLTATITPEYAEDKTVDWSVAFDNPSSAWATGKTVTDYVTVTPTSDGALTANVECLQDFGEQIIVTVTSRDNEEVSAECTVDYAKRIESAYLVGMGGEHIAESGNTWQTGMHDSFTETYIPQYSTYSVNYTYSDYTVEDTFTMTATAQLDATFLSGLKSYATDHMSEQTQYGYVIISDLSGEAKNPVYSGNQWYYTASSSGFFSLFYPNYGQPGASAMKQALNMLVGYVKEQSADTVNAVDYEVTFTGTHSSYTLNFTQVLSKASLTYAVTGIELDEDSIIF